MSLIDKDGDGTISKKEWMLLIKSVASKLTVGAEIALSPNKPAKIAALLISTIHKFFQDEDNFINRRIDNDELSQELRNMFSPTGE